MRCCMLQVRGGVERDRYGKKAGKGALLTYGHAPTIGVVQDATLIQVKESNMEESTDAICFEPGIAQREGNDNRFVDNLSPTLRACFSDNRPAVAVGVDSYNQNSHNETSETIRTSSGGDNYPKVACGFEPGITSREGNPSRVNEELSPTLRADMGDNQVATAMSYDGYNQTGKEEICHTLGTCNSESPNNDKVVKVITKQDEPKLKMVYHENGSNESFEVKGDAMVTLKSTSDATQAHNQLVLENEQPNIADTIASMRYIVRRLTPTECCRLMGLPDGYTIPSNLVITDELVKEFVEIHNNFNRIMWEYSNKEDVLGDEDEDGNLPKSKPPKPKTESQVRKWLEKIANPDTCPDAPRYKACGNGWATNQPRWILLRLLASEGINPWFNDDEE